MLSVQLFIISHFLLLFSSLFNSRLKTDDYDAEHFSIEIVARDQISRILSGGVQRRRGMQVLY